MDGDFFIRETVSPCGIGGGSRSGAAGHGLAGAPLPDPHLNVLPVDDPGKFRIHPVGEHGVQLKLGADGLQVQIGRLVDPDHGMGIAHGDAGHRPVLPGHIDLLSDHLVSQPHHGNLSRCCGGSAHINTHTGHLAPFHGEVQVLQPRLGLDDQVGLVSQPLVIDELGNAPDAVAAHGTLRAVCVVHSHPEIRHIRGIDGNQAVRSDALVAVAVLEGKTAGILHGSLGTVHIDVVVAAAVHLGKFHLKLLLSQNHSMILPLLYYAGF